MPFVPLSQFNSRAVAHTESHDARERTRAAPLRSEPPPRYFQSAQTLFINCDLTSPKSMMMNDDKVIQLPAKPVSVNP